MFRTDYQIKFLSLWKSSVEFLSVETWNSSILLHLRRDSCHIAIIRFVPAVHFVRHNSGTNPVTPVLSSCQWNLDKFRNCNIWGFIEILVYGDRLVTTVFWTGDSWFIIYREDIYYWVRPWAPRILHSNLHSALNVVSGRHTSGSVSLVIRAQGSNWIRLWTVRELNWNFQYLLSFPPIITYISGNYKKLGTLSRAVKTKSFQYEGY